MMRSFKYKFLCTLLVVASMVSIRQSVNAQQSVNDTIVS
jgi:hypothetical protein